MGCHFYARWKAGTDFVRRAAQGSAAEVGVLPLHFRYRWQYAPLPPPSALSLTPTNEFHPGSFLPSAFTSFSSPAVWLTSFAQKNHTAYDNQVCSLPTDVPLEVW